MGSVDEDAGFFVAEWNSALSLLPELRLDGSWPAVGTLDLILWPLRESKTLTAEWQRVVRGASCYLALMTRRIWEECGAPAYVFEIDGKVCVGVRGDSTPWRGGVCELERQLTEVVVNPPDYLPLVRNLIRPIGPDSALIAPLMGAMLSGLDPWTRYAQQPGGAQAENLSAYRVGRLARVLASDCVARYEQLYPDDQHGQVAELFLSGLVFPPLYVEEDGPAVGRAVELVRFFRGYGIGEQHIRRVCGRLARWPDEQISLTSYVVAAAYAEPHRAAELIPLGQAKGLLIGAVRRAYLEVRKELGYGASWAEGEGSAEESIASLRGEELLGFLPWLYMDGACVCELSNRKDVRRAFEAAIGFRLAEAVEILDECLTGEAIDTELRLQMIYWEMIQGDLDAAERRIRELAADDESCARNPRFYEVSGMCALQKGDLGGAIDAFEQGLPMFGRELEYQSNLANSLGWAYLCAGVVDRASYMLDLALRESRNPVTVLLNKVVCYERPGYSAKRHAWEARIAKLAPNDRRVVGVFARRVMAHATLGLAPVEAAEAQGPLPGPVQLDKAA